MKIFQDKEKDRMAGTTRFSLYSLLAKIYKNCFSSLVETSSIWPRTLPDRAI